MSESHSKTRWFPSSNARQILLNFQPVSGGRCSQDEKIDHPITASSRPSPTSPPSISNEVWTQILRPLGTIALKKFRLVCREWSDIGASWLFETVYINCYEKSWSGLISLSRSCHAARVRNIEWNALIFYPNGDDVVIWASRYQSLLRGLSHVNTVRLYNAYHPIYRTHESLKRSTSLDSAAEALQRLVNCHHAVVSDDYDFTTECDVSLRAAILNMPKVLRDPATWALRPPFLLNGQTDWSSTFDHVLESTADIFVVLAQSCNVKSMVLSYWSSHLDELTASHIWQDGRRKTKQSFQNNFLTSSHCQLKTPDRLLHPRFDPYTSHLPGYNGAISLFTNCSALRDIYLEVALSHPGGSEADMNHGRRRASIDSDVSSSIITAGSVPSNGLDDERHFEEPFIDSRPDGFTQAIFECLCSPLELWLLPLSHLRALTLKNVSVNMGLLLCFLCCQKQLPTSSFSLVFKGTVVLYDFVPRQFFTALKQLNVQISYSSRSTYYYLPTLFGGPLEDNQDDAPYLLCYIKQQTYHVLVHRNHGSIAPLSFPLDVDIGIPVNLPPCPSIAHQKPASDTVMILDRPDEYPYSTAYLANMPLDNLPTAHVYRLCEGRSHTIWEWVPETDALDPRTNRPRKGTHILLLLFAHLYEEPDYGYGCHGEEERYIQDALSFESDNSMQTHRSPCQQDILQQYEGELLGTDLLDLHCHLLDEAVDRTRSREAQMMPDSLEDLLHRYETELLGLDLLSANVSGRMG